jgi:hypothetical protein
MSGTDTIVQLEETLKRLEDLESSVSGSVIDNSSILATKM